jgi:two-component system, cell cycle response regulator DivK
VVLAADGQEAVELARDHSPKLILMDLQMPVMDGWEATRRLKSESRTAGIPIVAVTAEDHPPEHLREAGFCAYVRKPVVPQQLLQAVESCLEQIGQGTSWIDLPRFEAVPPTV